MKRLYFFCIFLCALSCNKILDVKPEDKFIDEQVFSTSGGIRNTLNEIYISMINGETLYGGNLTMTLLDVLAQYYDINNKNTLFPSYRYQYNDNSFISNSNAIWNGIYDLIFQTNVFIHGVQSSNVLSISEKEIILGESYGIRAFLMFDLFRMYGPIYSQDSSALSIPINHNIKLIRVDYSNANVVLESILKDIDTSLNYLKNDPILTSGVVPFDNGNDNFLKMRNRRFNYYAAEGLKARILLYQGNRNGAYQTAIDILNSAQKWFPFSAPSLSSPLSENPDRNFSSEIIFGVENPNLYNMQNNYFASSILDTKILRPAEFNLKNIYEDNLNDYRYRVDWKSIETTTKSTLKTFYKYADITDKSAPFRYLQPLIRISEIYYIVAESTDDINEANKYLNIVRNNRGLGSKIITQSTLRSEITKEYQKEFWGEGQLFFYYKRNNIEKIQNGSTQFVSEIMSANTYVFPLPQSETNYR